MYGRLIRKAHGMFKKENYDIFNQIYQSVAYRNIVAGIINSVDSRIFFVIKMFEILFSLTWS